MRKSYWAILILAALAAAVVFAYFKVNTPKVAPIVINHKTASSTAESELQDWKTYEKQKDNSVAEVCETVKAVDVLDFSFCHRCDSYSRAWGLGSDSLTLKGLIGNLCKTEYFTETEGGYSIYDCNIPTSLGKANMSSTDQNQRADLNILTKYCSTTPKKKGNLLQQ